jgi:hypothetical protein
MKDLIAMTISIVSSFRSVIIQANLRWSSGLRHSMPWFSQSWIGLSPSSILQGRSFVHVVQTFQ